jgi:hypothetical protein
MNKTHNEKIFVGKLRPVPFDEARPTLELLARVVGSSSREEMRAALGKVVPEMREPLDERIPTPPVGAPRVVTRRAERLRPATVS